MNSFEEIKSQTPKDIQIFIEKSFDIADEVDFVLEKLNKNRAFLAIKLNKNESEISKWLSGLHNLTIKSISKIEASLGETIISTPTQEAKKFESAIKSFERQIKKLQIKCDDLTKENQSLKKIIIGHNYSSRSKDYRNDPTTQSTIQRNVNILSEEMNRLYNTSSKLLLKEWSFPVFINAMDSINNPTNHLKEPVYITDEYENIAI